MATPLIKLAMWGGRATKDREASLYKKDTSTKAIQTLLNTAALDMLAIGWNSKHVMNIT